jgi:hypothetical protein
MWRKAITASTTFCQLRSSIFDLHLVNHVLLITLPACWELRYPCSNFSIRVPDDQRPCHVDGRRERKTRVPPILRQLRCRAPSVHRRDAKASATHPNTSYSAGCITTNPRVRPSAARLRASARIVAKFEQTAADGVSLLELGEHHAGLLVAISSSAVSALGRSRRFGLLSITSAPPRTTDVSRPGRHFAFVPQTDMATRRSRCIRSPALLRLEVERPLSQRHEARFEFSSACQENTGAASEAEMQKGII